MLETPSARVSCTGMKVARPAISVTRRIACACAGTTSSRRRPLLGLGLERRDEHADDGRVDEGAVR